MTKYLQLAPKLERSLEPLGVTRGRDQKGDLLLDCDTVIVGSGAGGAVIARALSEAGESVVVLEEGPYVAPLEHGALPPSHSLRNYWRGGGMTVAFGLNGQSINVTMGRAVGGSSLLTGGVCFRIPEYVLERWREERGLRDFTTELITTCQPAPTSPRTWLSGTSTASRNSSAVLEPCMPSLWNGRPRPTPRHPPSSTNAVMPFRPRERSTVAKHTMTSARSPVVMNVFCPETRHASPRRVAVVERLATSDPAPGSVMASDP